MPQETMRQAPTSYRLCAHRHGVANFGGANLRERGTRVLVPMGELKNSISTYTHVCTVNVLPVEGAASESQSVCNSDICIYIYMYIYDT